MSFLAVQRVCTSVANQARVSPRTTTLAASPSPTKRAAVAQRQNLLLRNRASSSSPSSFSVAALAVAVAAAAGDEVEEEEDATPSDGEVLSTSSPLLLPPGGGSGPAVAGALPAASSLFQGLKVLVVGATGRTGRLVVSRLAAEGVPVRCLVRDVAKARAVLPDASEGVTLVRGDLTQPSSLPLALADCNAVVWAAGVPSLVAMFKDPLAPLRVEAEGVANLVAVFERAVMKERQEKENKEKGSASPRFVLISSIGADSVVAQLAFPGGVLFWKKRGELALQRSSVLDWTIIRPGGLKEEGSGSGRGGGASGSSSSAEGVVAVGPDGIGFPSLFSRGSGSGSSSSRPPRQRPGSISRKAVADLAVDALVVPAAVGKVVEVVSRKDAPRRGAAELFANAEQN